MWRSADVDHGFRGFFCKERLCRRVRCCMKELVVEWVKKLDKI
jgi:hypothetical protein